MADAPDSLFEGRTFFDNEEFSSFLRKRQEIGEVWVKDAGGVSIAAANKKIQDPNKHFRTDFVVQYANFKCLHGGKHVPTAKDRNKGSKKFGCPCTLQISANRQENALVVTKYNPEHNHELVSVALEYALAVCAFSTPKIATAH
ncbi:hypothetical protein ElyMa_000238800 [Elysia marginata]|uniref:ZSWIM3 N-terminal domain-containing protein n=1 Tax=Elysia marginata TaxID=1093978 RepID=A0AAV4F372_9GAST|nr:hypothetical protein ElyMa_000238800 [Elysia marginata]